MYYQVIVRDFDLLKKAIVTDKNGHRDRTLQWQGKRRTLFITLNKDIIVVRNKFILIIFCHDLVDSFVQNKDISPALSVVFSASSRTREVVVLDEEL